MWRRANSAACAEDVTREEFWRWDEATGQFKEEVSPGEEGAVERAVSWRRVSQRPPCSPLRSGAARATGRRSCAVRPLKQLR